MGNLYVLDNFAMGGNQAGVIFAMMGRICLSFHFMPRSSFYYIVLYLGTHTHTWVRCFSVLSFL